MSKDTHASRDHARLSPSGAHRWLKCTPSAMLEAGYPSSTSVYAAEGTFVHELAELKVRYFLQETVSKEDYEKALNAIEKDSRYEPYMEVVTDQYVYYIQKVKDDLTSDNTVVMIFAEERLDLSDLVPGSFGTGDCILLAGDELHVFDYKNGQGVYVEVDENPQMLLYGYGAYMRYKALYQFKSVTVHVCQPRKNNMKASTVTVDDLLLWAADVRERAKVAAVGGGELCAGDHCKFCRVADCKELAKKRAEDARKVFRATNTLDEKGIAEALAVADLVAEWKAKLTDHVMKMYEDGTEFTHIQIAPGRGRTIIDSAREQDMLEALTSAGLSEAVLIDEKIKSKTAIMKEIKAKNWTKDRKAEVTEILDSYCKKVPGSLKVSPLKEVKETAEEVFKNI